MVRIVVTLAEWRVIARELAEHRPDPIPPGLAERVQALIAGAPVGWPNQPYGLDLNDESATAIRALQAAIAGQSPDAAQAAASVAEAAAIIRDHQRRRGDPFPSDRS